MIDGKKALLMLSGVAQMCEIVQDARAEGYYVIVTDYLLDSPAKKIADESWMLSIDDVDGIVKKCIERGVDGVMNYCIDPGQKPYQAICERLGMPCVGTREQFDIMTNKDKFKKACKAHNIGVLDEYGSDDSALPKDLSKIKYPVMVKPADGRASKGITVCYQSSELPYAIDVAMANSKLGRIVIEAFTKAPEVCAKYVVCEGEPFLTSMADVHPGYTVDGRKAYIGTQTYPSVFLEEFQLDTDNRIRQMIRDLGILNGALSFTGFYDNGVFKFFDPSFRMGGAQDWRLVANISGVDISKMLTNFAMTGSMGNIDEIRKIDGAFARKKSALLYFLVREGKIGEIRGIKDACSVDGVVGYHLPHIPGDVVTRFGTVDHVAIRFLVVCDTQKEFSRCVHEVQSMVDILDTNGESMLLPLFDPDRKTYGGGEPPRLTSDAFRFEYIYKNRREIAASRVGFAFALHGEVRCCA